MPKVSEAHRQARRQQILGAAAACFAREGFHRTSMQDIVGECGVSAGLVYRYFASKDEMIAAIATDWHADRAAVLDLGPADAGTPVAGPPGVSDRLGELATKYLELLRGLGQPEAVDFGRLAVQVWAETVRSPTIREVARNGVDEPRASIGELLRTAQGKGEFPPQLDPDALVRVLIAVYQGLLVQTVWDDTVDNARYVDAVAVLLEPLLAPEGAVRRDQAR